MDSLYEEMDRIFHPRSMASVGAADKIGNMGISYLMGYRKYGFPGALYAVNPTNDTRNFATYPNLIDIPGPVDEARIAVPAQYVPNIIRDCVRKGVRCATIFASGFRETGTTEGAQREEEAIGIARQGGLRLIGPNCMGILCPDSGMSIRADMPLMKDGRIGLISQSGGIAISFSLAAREKNLGLSKVVSYGNEIDLGSPEFLHYLSRDPKTGVICLYIEGTRRPEELVAALRDAAARKPVIMVKGGLTRAGNRAASSHTGALTGTSAIWKAVAKQTGVIMTDDTEEMLDLAMLFTPGNPPPGRRLGIISLSGGLAVIAADLVITAGLEIPPLSQETRTSLRQFINVPGTSVQNPIDLSVKFLQFQTFPDIFSALDDDPNTDAFVIICAVEYMTYLSRKGSDYAMFLSEAMVKALNTMKKPSYIVLLHTAAEDIRCAQERYFIERGYPVFPTMQRCLLSIQRAMGKQ